MQSEQCLNPGKCHSADLNKFTLQIEDIFSPKFPQILSEALSIKDYTISCFCWQEAQISAKLA